MLNWLTTVAPARTKIRAAMLTLQIYLIIQLAIEVSGYLLHEKIGHMFAINIAALLIGQIIVQFSWWGIIKLVVAPLEKIADLGERLRRGETFAEVPYIENEDCAGRLAKNLVAFADSNREQKEAEKRSAAAALREKESKEKLEARDRESHEAVSEVGEALRKLASGDLSIRIRGQRFSDEFKPLQVAFNSSLDKLGEALGQVLASATMIAEGSREISTASDDLASRTEKQASSLTSISASVTEVSKGVLATAASCTKVSAGAKGALGKVKDASEGMDRVTEAMTAIQSTSTDISSIISLVKDIAARTELLSFNASIEAARAGDAGRGFSVVAREVKALATQSSDAAGDIEKKLASSSIQVQVGVDTVKLTADLLRDVRETTDDVAGRIDTVATSTNSQAESLQAVSSSIVGMDGMTQQNAAMVEESTAVSHQLTQTAQQLRKTLSKFRIPREFMKAIPGSAVEQPTKKNDRAPMAERSDVVEQAGRVLRTTSEDDSNWKDF